MIKTVEQIDDFFNSRLASFANGNLRDNRVKRMEILLERLGNPEKFFNTYHIAGSKGKGTCASYLSKLIEKSGRRCGLYLSPHVYDVRERFTLSTSFFPLEAYLDTINELELKIRDFSLPCELGPEKPTTFELYTAYGYLLFKNAKCTDAVIETGLGGRLDATNTLTPKATIFTNIELEHTNVLGNTYEEIAKEKLGILRKGVYAFCSQRKLYDIIKKEYADLHCPTFLFDEYDFDKINYKVENNCYIYKEADGNSIEIENDSRIIHFDALYAYFIASKLGRLKQDDSKIIDLRSISLPARFEKATITKNDKKLFLILDGAHTVKSCKEALKSLENNNGYNGNTLLIFSLADGKKLNEIANEVFPKFKRIIITGLGDFKKSNPEQIHMLAKKIVPNSTVDLIQSPIDVANKAIAESENGSTILVLGSFYLASRMKSAFKEVSFVN